MKAAFLFSGQLRGFPFCVKAFEEHLFNSFEEYDTFFYLPQPDGKVLFDCLSPTAATLEKDQTHPEIPNFQHNICHSDQRSVLNQYAALAHMQHYFLQWYGVKRVFDLFENYKLVNNVEYDVVFRVRPDIIFHEKFVYEPFDGIQVPNLTGHGGVYDRLAFGSIEYMKYYCGLYDSIMSGKYNNYAYTGNSESKLRQHLEANNTPIRQVHMNFNHSVNKDGSY